MDYSGMAVIESLSDCKVRIYETTQEVQRALREYRMDRKRVGRKS